MTDARAPEARESVHIRHAEPRDAGELVELAQAVASEPEGWLITDGGWRSAAEERRYLRSIRDSPRAAVLVAETPERIVGRLSIGRDPHPASDHVADLGLMVLRAYRRRGAGRALMRAAETWALRVGVTKIELHVFPHNGPAIALYESLGYEREGFRRSHYRRRDRLLDAVLMAKEL